MLWAGQPHKSASAIGILHRQVYEPDIDFGQVFLQRSEPINDLLSLFATTFGSSSQGRVALPKHSKRPSTPPHF